MNVVRIAVGRRIFVAVALEGAIANSTIELSFQDHFAVAPKQTHKRSFPKIFAPKN